MLEGHEVKGLIRLELKFQRELEEFFPQEELLWHQKSRKDWFMHGYRNTVYYHQKTITRQRGNRIDVIINDSGQWLYDTESIKWYAVSFFSALYFEDNINLKPYHLRRCFLVLDGDILPFLNRLIDDIEIRNTLLGMKPLKAPRLTGFTLFFTKLNGVLLAPLFAAL